MGGMAGLGRSMGQSGIGNEGDAGDSEVECIDDDGRGG